MSASNSRFVEIFDETANVGSETAWELLPEKIYDLYNGLELPLEDFVFLSKISWSNSATRYENVAAIRIIGILTEAKVFRREWAIALLKNTLRSPKVWVRYYSVKAIWQAKLTELLPDLKECLTTEENPATLEMIQRTISVLEAK